MPRPITQARLLRILEAAEAYQKRYRELHEANYTRCSAIVSGTLTPAEAFREHTDHLTFLTSYLPAADLAITEERTHYRFTHTHNDIEKDPTDA